jgi:hypothetical protein
VPALPAAGGARLTLAGPAAGALTIVAIADDPGLLEALTRAGGERDLVITSPTADRFVDQLVANAAAVAVIDAGCAPQPLEGFIERIHAQFPQLLLILAGSAPLQAAYKTRLVDGTLFRFAHKPTSAQRMQLFIAAARRHLESGGAGAHHPPGAPPALPQAARPARPLRPALLGALLLGALLGLGWWLLQPDAVVPRARIPAPAHPARERPQPARIAAMPAPAGPTVDDPLASVAAERAAAMIAQASALPPVSAAMPPGLWLQLARARLASHNLLDPAGDSALFYVEAAQALAPSDPEVGAAARSLGEALIAQTRSALNAGDAASARRWLRACTDYRVSQATLTELSARLQRLEASAQ